MTYFGLEAELDQYRAIAKEWKREALRQRAEVEKLRAENERLYNELRAERERSEALANDAFNRSSVPLPEEPQL